MTQPSSIQRFFSELTATSGPFELMGLTPDQFADEALNEALKRQLERLTFHPHAQGPDAEQARLALHVAAAQLRDPAVRAALIEEYRLTRLAPQRTPSTTPDLAIAAELAPFEAEAIAAIAAARGWNPHSARAVASIAQRHGIPLPAAMARVSGLARRVDGPVVQNEPEKAPTIDPDERRVARAVRKWFTLGLTLLLIASTISLALLLSRVGAVPAASAVDSSLNLPESESPSQETLISPAPFTGAAPNPVITPSLQDGPSVVPPAPEAPRALAAPVQKWVTQAEVLLSPRAEQAPQAEERLAHVVQLARLNLAARLIWSGDGEAGARALRAAAVAPSLSVPLAPDRSQDPGTLTAPGAAGDGTLALELLALRRSPGRGLELFKNRRFTRDTLGPVDCDVVAESALFGSPQEVRLIARKIVTDQADNPAMMHALLEIVSRASPQSSLSSMIEEITERSLPRAESAEWKSRARAALLERLAELIARVMLPDVDAFADMLADAYAGRDAAPGATREPPGTPRDGPEPPHAPQRDPDRSEDAAQELWDALLREAAPMRSTRAGALALGAVVQRSSVRSSLASGPVQRFVAAQCSILDLMALIVACESPSASVESLMENTRLARNAAAQAFEQMEVNERAIARLWILRFNGAARKEQS